MRSLLLRASFLASLAVVSMAQAQTSVPTDASYQPTAAPRIYTWRDAQGVVHHTDTPPPSQQKGVSEQLIKRPQKAAEPAPSTSSGPLTQAAPTPEATYAKSCEAAQKNLGMLTSKDIEVMTGGPGQADAVKMDAAQRAAATDRARAQVRAYCDVLMNGQANAAR